MTDSKATFTPGPWTANYDDYGDELWFGGPGCGLWSIKGPDVNFGGHAYLGGDGDDPEAKAIMDANAHLIAAAPDLYAALMKCIEVLEFAYMTAPEQPKEIEIARQALAKARGEN